MKTLVLFFFALSASLAGASLTTARSTDAALIFASVFAASLIAWTFRQYERKYYPLTRARPFHLPIGDSRRDSAAPPRRLAA